MRIEPDYSKDDSVAADAMVAEDSKSDDLNCLGTMYLPAKHRMISSEPCLEDVLIAGPSAALPFVWTYDEIM